MSIIGILLSLMFAPLAIVLAIVILIAAIGLICGVSVALMGPLLYIGGAALLLILIKKLFFNKKAESENK